MVILAVLAILLVAMAICAGLTDSGLEAQRLMDHAAAREANYLVARSAIELGMEVLRADDNDTDGPQDPWAVGEVNLEWEGRQVTLRLVDEESRFPLGRLQAAPDDESGQLLAQALERLLRRAGMPDATAAVQQLLDWVDPDPIRRPRGAELGDYGQQPVKDGPLDSLAELKFLPAWEQAPGLAAPKRPPPPQLEGLEEAQASDEIRLVVPGPETMGSGVSSEWSDWLSLHSNGKTNINTAPPELLLSLDPDLGQVTVDEIIRRRQQEAFASSDDLRRVPGVDADLAFRLEKVLGYHSDTFEIRATIDHPSANLTLKAVVRRGQGPMQVLWWEVQ
jgi:general secretion pathway protein K